MILDPTTPIGRVRLRVADYSDLPLLPDEVYQATLDELNGSLVKASVRIASYILGMLTSQTHQKLSQIEVFGAEWYSNYKDFLRTTILNPNFMDMTPMPFVAQVTDQLGHVVDLPLVQFQKDWNNNFITTLQSTDMHLMALPPSTIPNDPFNILGGVNG